jgi:hypothetical protein
MRADKQGKHAKSSNHRTHQSMKQSPRHHLHMSSFD